MTKRGAEKIQAAAMGHNSETLKSYVDRILDLKKEQQERSMDILAVYNEADDAGFNRKELKTIIKEKMKPTGIDFRQAVNQMLISLGDKPLFAQAPGTAEATEEAA